jgi:hypothetical protein
VLVLKTKKDHFECIMHQGLVSQSLLKLDVFVSFLFQPLGSGRSCGVCYMLNTFLWTSTSYVAWFSKVQIEIVYMSTLFLLFCEWFESCYVDLHGVVIECKHHMFGLQHEWHELFQCWWQFPSLLLSTFKKSIITTLNLRDCLIQGRGIRHGQ